MSHSWQATSNRGSVPKVAIIVLAAIFTMGVFLVGFDQGETLSLVYGQDAYLDAFLHEVTHDMRHAAGFPCH